MVKKPNRRISSHHFLNQTKTFPISDAPGCRTHDEPKKARHRADHHDHKPILSPRGVYTVDGIRLGDVENRLGRKRAHIYSGTNWGSAIRTLLGFSEAIYLRIPLEPDVLKADVLKEVEGPPEAISEHDRRHPGDVIVSGCPVARPEHDPSLPSSHDNLGRPVDEPTDEGVAVGFLPGLDLAVRPPDRILDHAHGASSPCAGFLRLGHLLVELTKGERHQRQRNHEDPE